VATKTYVLTVREAPKSNNAGGGGARQHHFAAAKEKKRLQGLYLMELMVGRVKRDMTHCNVAITVLWKRANHRDEENFRQSIIKPLHDALVEGGYLPDDTRREVEVTDFKFEYPAIWPFPAPLRGVQVITLEATYPD
jgi:hypothetical protein